MNFSEKILVSFFAPSYLLFFFLEGSRLKVENFDKGLMLPRVFIYLFFIIYFLKDFFI